jgi:spore coat polysaccharide biosynthesis protein SpsF
MKIGALIPIRLASERLPGKAILEVAGKPLVCHLLDRVFASRYISDKRDVIVCTTEDTSDDMLAHIVTSYGASIFRGSTDDIIKRFNDAIIEHKLDYILQVDGDDILCATEYMDLTMESLLGNDSLDIVTCEGLPLGIASKSFTQKAMAKVYEVYQTDKNDTGFIYYFTKTGLCNQEVITDVSPEHILDEARLTLDYASDLEVFTKIIEALYSSGELLEFRKIIQYLKQHPKVMEINAGLEDEYWQRTRDKAKLSFTDEDGLARDIEL